LSAALSSPTFAFFKLMFFFNQDCSLEWLEAEADATPATKRAKAAIFMLAECLGEQKQQLNGIAANNWIYKLD